MPGHKYCLFLMKLGQTNCACNLYLLLLPLLLPHLFLLLVVIPLFHSPPFPLLPSPSPPAPLFLLQLSRLLLHFKFIKVFFREYNTIKYDNGISQWTRMSIYWLVGQLKDWWVVWMVCLNFLNRKEVTLPFSRRRSALLVIVLLSQLSGVYFFFFLPF